MDIRTPSRDLVRAMQAAFESSTQAWPIARDFGLAAIGAKPVAHRSHKCDREGRLRYGLAGRVWDPLPLIRALRADGVAVVVDDPVPGADAAVAVSLDRTRASLAIRLFDEARAHGVVGPAGVERRLGALFGYPESGTLALLGRRREAPLLDVLSRLDPCDWTFTGCKFAGDEAGLRDAVAYARRQGRAWRTAFGDLGGKDESFHLAAVAAALRRVGAAPDARMALGLRTA